MNEQKQYSVLYSFTSLDGLQKAIMNIAKDKDKFTEIKGFRPTFIPHQNKGDPLAQKGYIGGTFYSEHEPNEPLAEVCSRIVCSCISCIPCDEGAK